MLYIKRTLMIILGIVITIYFVRAFDSRTRMPLTDEHRISLEGEYDADKHAGLDWSGYLKLEETLRNELEVKLADRSTRATVLNRHAVDSAANPLKHEVNWNLSYQTEPVVVKGSAVLIHGLTDSPYSVKATAEAFAEAGFTTFAPRMPGHGFNVGSLPSSDAEDWMGVVELSVKAADAVRKPGQPLVIGGYSNGAVLAVMYAIECSERGLPCPDRILLLSPAIAISKFAWFALWHRGVSWIPYFEQFKWESIYPEVDAYKFTSFPKSPGFETLMLAADISRALSDGDLELPPTLVFQSVVDATVSTRAVLNFFVGLGGNQHEIVFYDLNRYQHFSEWVTKRLDDVYSFTRLAPLPITVTILSNQSTGGNALEEFRLESGSTEYVIGKTQLEWPTAVFSLSHIAVPFPPDDQQYGEQGQAIGTYHPRGERNVISLSPDYFRRMRYNPFYEYQAGRIKSWLADLTVAD
jgi:alpha-beta hydrolase superfamily lysophospholipase